MHVDVEALTGMASECTHSDAEALIVDVFQNVLIQMGLNVISVDGMLIRQAKSFVLRCYACFK